MYKLVAPVAVALVALLAACGGSDDDESARVDETAEPSPATTRTVAPERPVPTDTALAEATPTTESPAGQPTPPPPTRTSQQPVSNAPTPPPAPSPTTASAPPTQPIPQSLTIYARDTRFVPAALAATTQSTIAVLFVNEDAGVQHDIVIYGPAGGLVVQSQTIVGPSQTQVTFAAETAGDYFFKCSLHPWNMTGAVAIH